MKPLKVFLKHTLKSSQQTVERLKDLVIYSGNDWEDEAGKHILKQGVLDMFDNVKEIVIYAAKHNEAESYQSDLFSLILKLNANRFE